MGGNDKKQAEEGLTGVGDKVSNAAKQTPEEAQQYSGSFDIGNLLKQISEYQMGVGQAPAGYQNANQQFLNQTGDVGQNYYNQILKQSQDPYANYESSLQPALQQAQDATNQYYQKRGLINSGLAIEGMGRAGVDLAIKEAQGRMDAYQNSMGNVSGYLSNIQNTSQNNYGNLANLYNTQQQAGQTSMGRQATGAVNAGQYYSYPYQAQLGSYYGGQAALQALPGQLISGGSQIAAAAATPVPVCWVASEIFGGWYEPKTIIVRKWIINKAPKWFKEFYIKNGEYIALFISNKPILKLILKPLFELFAKWGA